MKTDKNCSQINFDKVSKSPITGLPSVVLTNSLIPISAIAIPNVSVTRNSWKIFDSNKLPTYQQCGIEKISESNRKCVKTTKEVFLTKIRRRKDEKNTHMTIQEDRHSEFEEKNEKMNRNMYDIATKENYPSSIHSVAPKEDSLQENHNGRKKRNNSRTDINAINSALFYALECFEEGDVEKTNQEILCMLSYNTIFSEIHLPYFEACISKILKQLLHSHSSCGLNLEDCRFPPKSLLGANLCLFILQFVHTFHEGKLHNPSNIKYSPLLYLSCDYLQILTNQLKNLDSTFNNDPLFVTFNSCINYLVSLFDFQTIHSNQEFAFKAFSLATLVFRLHSHLSDHLVSLRLLLKVYENYPKLKTAFLNDLIEIFDTLILEKSSNYIIVCGGVKIQSYSYLLLKILQVFHEVCEFPSSIIKGESSNVELSYPGKFTEQTAGNKIIEDFQTSNRKLQEESRLLASEITERSLRHFERKVSDKQLIDWTMEKNPLLDLILDLICVECEPEFPSAHVFLAHFCKILINKLGRFNLVQHENSPQQTLLFTLTVYSKILASYIKMDVSTEMIELTNLRSKMIQEQVESAKISHSNHDHHLAILNHLFPSTNPERYSEVDGRSLFCSWICQLEPSESVSFLSLYRHYETQTLSRFLNESVSRREALAAAKELLHKSLVTEQPVDQLKQIFNFLNHKSAVVRYKVLKLITSIITESWELSQLPWIRDSVSSRILDQSVLVRECAIDLIGQLIFKFPDQLTDNIPILLDRVMDTGLSVRKRVLRILRDIIINQEKKSSFLQVGETNISEHIISIYTKILSRVNDESSISEFVVDTFQNMWFSHLLVANTYAVNNKKVSFAESEKTIFTSDNEFKHKIEIFSQLLSDNDDSFNNHTNITHTTNVYMNCQTVLTRIYDRSVKNNTEEHFRDVCTKWSLAIFKKIKKEFNDANFTEMLNKKTFSILRLLQLFLAYSSGELYDDIPYFLKLIEFCMKNRGIFEIKILQISAQIIRTLFSTPNVKLYLNNPQITSSIEKLMMELVIKQSNSIMTEAIHTLYYTITFVSNNTALISDCFEKYFTYLKKELTKYSSVSTSANIRATICRCIVTVGLLLKHFSIDQLSAHKNELSFEKEVINVLIEFYKLGPADISLKTLKALGSYILSKPKILLSSSLKVIVDKIFTQIIASCNIINAGAGSSLKEIYILMEIFHGLLKSENDRAEDDSNSRENIKKKSSKQSSLNNSECRDHPNNGIRCDDSSYVCNNNSSLLQVVSNGNLTKMYDQEDISSCEEISDSEKTETELCEIIDKRSSVISEIFQKYLKFIISCYITSEVNLRMIINSIVCLVVRLGLIHPLHCVPCLVCMESGGESESIRETSLSELKTVGSRHLGILSSYFLSGLKMAYQLHSSTESRSENCNFSPVRGFFHTTANSASNIPTSNNFPCVDSRHQRLYAILSASKPHRRQFLLSTLNSISQPDDDFGMKLYLVDNLATFNYRLQDEILFVIYHINLTLISTASVKLELLISIQNANEISPVEINSCMVTLLLLLLKKHLSMLYQISENKLESYLPTIHNQMHNQSITQNLSYMTELNNISAMNEDESADLYPVRLPSIIIEFLKDPNLAAKRNSFVEALRHMTESLFFECQMEFSKGSKLSQFNSDSSNCDNSKASSSVGMILDESVESERNQSGRKIQKRKIVNT